MKKEILLSTILCFSLENIAFAEDLEVITIETATKTQKTIDGVAASVIVVTQKEIEQMGATSLKDIINKTSGLNVQYGTFPSASSKSKSSISIRGMGANGTLFLLDGRRLAGEVKNPYDLDRIPASTIERIEIVKGPMSTLYGADAVGGVINIITKKATEKLSVNLGLKYGQNSDGNAKTKNGSIDLRGKSGNFSYSLFANKTTTTPYTQNETANVMVKQPTGKVKPSQIPLFATLNDTYKHDVSYREESDTNTIGGRLAYDINDSTTIGLDLNTFEEELEGSYIGIFHKGKAPNGKPVPIFNAPVDTKDENKRTDVSIDLTSKINEDMLIKLKAYKAYYKKRNTTTATYFKEMGFPTKEASASNGMNANVDIRSYEATLNYAVNENHLLTFGAEKRDEKRNATVFDNTPNMTTKEVNYKSVYIQDEWMINDSLNAIIGGRYDKVSNADNKATFKIGVVKNVTDLVNVRALFAQGYRTPDIREMYINKQTPNGLQQGADVVGYDLKPELTNTYEIGIGGRNSKVSYDLALFFNDIEDKISQVPNGQNKYTFKNINEAQTKGLELSFGYNILDNLSTNFTYTELRTEDKKTKKDLEFNPERTISLGFNYQVTNALNLMTNAKYIGKQYYTNSPAKQTNETDAFTLVDVNANYDVNKNLSIYLGANNIFDEKVDDILGSNVGTFYFTGIRAKF